MWSFRRIELPDIFARCRLVSFVGGGGKTTLIEALASALLQKGRRPLITTTTKIYAHEPYVLLSEYKPGRARSGPVIRVGKGLEEGKLTGLSEEEIGGLLGEADILLVEADGAKRMPLKAPASHEPVIPASSDLVVVVAGLDAIGARAEEKVFRLHLIDKGEGIGPDTIITPQVFARFFSPDLLMKGVDRARCVIALNKYDRAASRVRALNAGTLAADQAGVATVLITSGRLGIYYAIEKTGRLSG